ncbi:MAG: hypothetical protein IPN24_11305 [Betaproteobacteria bacterium]|nr:hypothetical protein [Betaproteobacteria bacterium]
MIATSNRAADLTGLRVGRLTVLRRVEAYIQPDGRRRGRWLCVCDCGKEITALTGNLTAKRNTGRVQSCGCLKREADITVGHRLSAARNTKRTREREERPAAAARQRKPQSRAVGLPTPAWGNAKAAALDLAAALGYVTGGKDD